MSNDSRRKEDPAAVGQSPVAGFAMAEGRADDPMTDKQAAILRDLAETLDEPFDGNLTRGQAKERIDALRARADD